MNDSDPIRRDRVDAWRTAIGLQAVDGLEVSDYLINLAVRNIEGEITFEEVETLLESHYSKKADIEVVKPDVQASKPDICPQKTDIADTFPPKTASQILKLRKAFPGQTIFSRTDLMKVLHLKTSRTSDLIKTMREHELIVPMFYFGKGKYRFQ